MVVPLDPVVCDHRLLSFSPPGCSEVQVHELKSETQLGATTLGVVCPMASEAENAVRFVDEVLGVVKPLGFKGVLFFAILDRACKDNTLELLQDLAKHRPELKVVWAPENRSVVDAYVRGYREALAAGCDWILEIDAGYSHQPADIPRFVSKIGEGYDCMFGSRFCEGGSINDTSTKRRLLSRGGSVLANVLLGTKLKDMTSGFEMFSRPVLQGILDKGIQSRGPFFQTEIKAYCRTLSFAEVPINYRGASHHISSTSLKDAFSNLWRLLRLRLSGRL
ncbi:MAG TPA: glycosyltransferase [Pyrinomonadaceae bacterium]|nr:glycosyltransferase [Pyrinomonadaceae bacterium]